MKIAISRATKCKNKILTINIKTEIIFKKQEEGEFVTRLEELYCFINHLKFIWEDASTEN